LRTSGSQYHRLRLALLPIRAQAELISTHCIRDAEPGILPTLTRLPRWCVQSCTGIFVSWTMSDRVISFPVLNCSKSKAEGKKEHYVTHSSRITYTYLDEDEHLVKTQQKLVAFVKAVTLNHPERQMVDPQQFAASAPLCVKLCEQVRVGFHRRRQKYLVLCSST